MANVKGFILAALVLASCSGSREDTQTGQGASLARRTAMERLGKEVEYLPSPDGLLILCTRATKPTSQHPQQTIHFLVFDTNAGKTIYDDSVTDGEVSWADNRRLRIAEKPGIIQGNDTPEQGFIYLVDVRTHQRTSWTGDSPRRTD